MITPPELPKRYTLQEFIQSTAQKDKGQGLFELETERLLELNLNGKIHTKMGSMVAYHGQVKFTRESIMSRGVGNLLKKAVSGEGARITDAEGQGTVYLADQGKKISIIQLNNEDIVVNGNDILAFESGVQYDIKMMKRVAAMLSGGLFNIRLRGTGLVAITSHYEPRTLLVEPGKPVVTDPNATVAWSGSLEPQIKTDISLKSFFGRGSGESFQMLFEGSGFVTIQPFEEVSYQTAS